MAENAFEAVARMLEKIWYWKCLKFERVQRPQRKEAVDNDFMRLIEMTITGSIERRGTQMKPLVIDFMTASVNYMKKVCKKLCSAKRRL